MGDRLSDLLRPCVFTSLPALCPSWFPSVTSPVRGPSVAGCSELPSSCLSAGHRGALGTAGVGTVLGSSLCGRPPLGPPLYVPPHPLCLAVPQS